MLSKLWFPLLNSLILMIFIMRIFAIIPKSKKLAFLSSHHSHSSMLNSQDEAHKEDDEEEIVQWISCHFMKWILNEALLIQQWNFFSQFYRHFSGVWGREKVTLCVCLKIPKRKRENYHRMPALPEKSSFLMIISIVFNKFFSLSFCWCRRRRGILNVWLDFVTAFKHNVKWGTWGAFYDITSADERAITWRIRKICIVNYWNYYEQKDAVIIKIWKKVIKIYKSRPRAGDANFRSAVSSSHNNDDDSIQKGELFLNEMFSIIKERKKTKTINRERKI